MTSSSQESAVLKMPDGAILYLDRPRRASWSASLYTLRTTGDSSITYLRRPSAPVVTRVAVSSGPVSHHRTVGIIGVHQENN
jgi:hypothetical protein